MCCTFSHRFFCFVFGVCGVCDCFKFVYVRHSSVVCLFLGGGWGGRGDCFKFVYVRHSSVVVFWGGGGGVTASSLSMLLLLFFCSV